MPIDVSEALDEDTAETVTVERIDGGQYVDGIYQPGVPTTFTTLCSVQQPSAIELERLPQGERDKDLRLFVSAKPLLTTGDRGGQEADVVIYQGNRYTIIHSADWSVYGHTTAIGARAQ